MTLRTGDLRERITDTRRHTLEMVQTLDDAELLAVPTDRPDRWSIAMVLDHLRLVDSSCGAVIRRLAERQSGAGPAPPSIETSFDPAEVALGVLDYAVFRGAIPDGTRGREVRDELHVSLEALLRDVDLACSTDCSERKLPHPVLGPLTAYEWIVFVEVHELGHQSQIRELAGETK